MSSALSNIRFLDGPAANQVLNLRRAPVVLRVVQSSRGNWDALDQVGDVANAQERIYLYGLQSVPRFHFIRSSQKSLSGGWANAEYSFMCKQPAEFTMRDNDLWNAWCDQNQTAIVTALPADVREYFQQHGTP